MNEKVDKLLRKKLRSLDEKIKFDAKQFFGQMLKQPIKKRIGLAFRILRGK